METDKLKWIEKIIDSGRELKKLRASDDLYKRILLAMEQPGVESGSLSFIQFRQLIIAASVLVIVNIGVLLYTSKSIKKQVQSAYTVDSYNLSLY